MPDYHSAYDRKRLQVIDRVLPHGAGPAADIGCSNGTITGMIASHGYDVVGYDIDGSAVTEARRLRPDLQFRCGSAAEAAEVGSRSLTVCVEVIEHLPFEAQAEFLAAVSDSTRPGGSLVLSTPGRYSALSLLQRGRRLHRHREYDWWDPTHVGILSFRRLRRLLETTGFTPRTWTGYCYLPPRVCPPFSVDQHPVNRLGFDLLVVAVRR